MEPGISIFNVITRSAPVGKEVGVRDPAQMGGSQGEDTSSTLMGIYHALHLGLSHLTQASSPRPAVWQPGGAFSILVSTCLGLARMSPVKDYPSGSSKYYHHLPTPSQETEAQSWQMPFAHTTPPRPIIQACLKNATEK